MMRPHPFATWAVAGVADRAARRAWPAPMLAIGATLPWSYGAMREWGNPAGSAAGRRQDHAAPNEVGDEPTPMVRNHVHGHECRTSRRHPGRCLAPTVRAPCPSLRRTFPDAVSLMPQPVGGVAVMHGRWTRHAGHTPGWPVRGRVRV